MDPSELLRHVVSVCERLRVRYLVTGPVATTYYGEPRYTNDIDVVTALPARCVDDFCRAFPRPEFYLDEQAVREAVTQCGQFNIIHPTSGLKVDMTIPDDSPFNHSRFARATRVQPGADYEASFAAPEDVIIKKLEYYRAGGSEKHLRDVAGVLKISGDQVDRAYIADWAARLGLTEIWKVVQQRSEG